MQTPFRPEVFPTISIIYDARRWRTTFWYILYLWFSYIFLQDFTTALALCPMYRRPRTCCPLRHLDVPLKMEWLHLQRTCQSGYQVKPCLERESPAKLFTPSSVSYKLKAFLRLSFQKCIWCSSRPLDIFYISTAFACSTTKVSKAKSWQGLNNNGSEVPQTI